ncbi:Eag protein [Yersinia enterocolitica]|uniref:Eag protein n=1 Tax=Yersinia enterocolitica TaxID=630 RepID=UPI001C60B087|nr:Eag protein [Yersinia enterocolitica]EKN5129274.1 Eag protein [Yersinia enterocolitica]MBW5869528.1 Eag protein [Yersinia enterocolitica]MBW5879243.1 Eag protein [Yersinia enterocolitica]
MRSCPKCGSGNVDKDKQRGGWTGDYVCGDCGHNDDSKKFNSETKSEKQIIDKKTS